MFFLVIPTPANAGIFSFLGNLFEKTKTTLDESSQYNSQTVALLQAALSPDPNPSKGGGDITIVGDSALLPDSGPLGTIVDIKETLQTDQISVYVVRDGDSLSQIAKMFSVSVNTIIWANNIRRGSFIQIGQNLIILPVSGVRYTVKKGDTLAGITKKLKGNLEEIKQFNDIRDNASLVVGQVIVVPDGELGTPTYRPVKYTAKVHGTEGPSYVGYYLRPAPGIRTQGLHGFNAVDIAGYYGEPIIAAASGNVIISRPYGWNGGYGIYTVIAHKNGTQTLYSHMSSLIVSAGSRVVQGQVIGYIGSTGRSTGPHVHFEIRGAKNPF